MFETAELGQKASKKDYEARKPELRERLLEAQARLRSADFPVIVLFAGVDGAGKSETANLLSQWMDPRGIVTRAFGVPSDEERERPKYWRFWRDLPPAGQIGIFLSAWYSQPLLRRVYGETTPDEHDHELSEIIAFERMLVNDGALILKFWMHLSRDAQKRRLKSLEKDALQSWRVCKDDWKHWKMYDTFIEAAEHTIMRTSTGLAPWKIIEGEDGRFRSLKVSTLLAEAIEARLEQEIPSRHVNPLALGEAESMTSPSSTVARDVGPTVLSTLELTKKVSKKDYLAELEKAQARLNRLHRKAFEQKRSAVLVFEGWDAAGKGGAIRRLTPALDARSYEVISIAAPTDEEKAQHYLWRFWRHLSRAGRVTIFDRSWYGRVLVERVEEFASAWEWSRAYAEINDFERNLVDHGIVLMKFWIHITPDEQEKRFLARAETPYKRWKLTAEDWRNREKWSEYEAAVNDMVERTSTNIAPWILVEGNDKRYARIRVIRAVNAALEKALG